MKDPIVANLFSTQPLTEQLACHQISALSSFGGGLIRPDVFDAYEPVRLKFDPKHIEEPATWLSRPHGTFMYAKGKPRHMIGWMRNNMPGQVWVSQARDQPPVPVAKRQHPEFVNNWTTYFDGRWAKRIGLEKLRHFAREMFEVSNAEFGFVTTEVDLNAKNFRDEVEPSSPTRVGYVGLDPEHGIPGLYWVTLFGPKLVSWLGLKRMAGGPVTVQKFGDGSMLLQFGETPDDCQSPEVLVAQRDLIEKLGEDKFFDIRYPDREMRVPKWKELSQNHDADAVG